MPNKQEKKNYEIWKGKKISLKKKNENQNKMKPK